MIQEVLDRGFAVGKNVYTEVEIDEILDVIDHHSRLNKNFKINEDLFAVRCFLKELPQLKDYLINDPLKKLLSQFGEDYNLVKAIYFDKPMKANWIVNWHQDLTISVKEKHFQPGFDKWLPKEDYFSVQPPQKYLENIVTIRAHLDDCTIENGALRVMPNSHLEICELKNLNQDFFMKEEICEVPKGGVLIMKPLLWHSSKRTENNQKRRVIHMEFSNLELPEPLSWAEYLSIHPTLH